MTKISETSKGIILLITSAFCFALMAAFVRLAGDIHFAQKAFFRNAVSFVIAFVLLAREVKVEGKEILVLPKGSLIFLILRAAAGTAAIFGNFYAIDRLVLADAAILNKMAPFFTILFCFLIMKEKMELIPFMAIVIAFLGALLVIKPSFDFTKMLPSLIAFGGGVGAGLAYACIRKLSYLKCNGKIIILFFSTVSMLCSIPYMIFHFNPMTLQQVVILCGAGACAAGGQFSITAAYYHAPAAKISIYDYTQIIFSTMLGLIFFDQIPDYLSLIGYTIIIAMAVVNYIYNRRKSEIYS